MSDGTVTTNPVATDQELSFCKKEIGTEPDVRGWEILVKAPEIREKIGSIFRAVDAAEQERKLQNVGLVLKRGNMAFVDRFQERECQVGDWIHYSKLARSEVIINGHLCFYIRDENVMAILPPDDLDMYLPVK